LLRGQKKEEKESCEISAKYKGFYNSHLKNDHHYIQREEENYSVHARKRTTEHEFVIAQQWL
jgi:hypothetical protein